MPRLKQVTREKATALVRKYYDQVFGDRDPVAQPGTATGTPGNWWTVFALVPHLFDLTTRHFATYGMFADSSLSKLDPKIREIATLRTGFVQGSLFVFSQHCKVARGVGLSEPEIESVASWQISTVYTPTQRAVLAYTDCLLLQAGRVTDAIFDALKTHLSDEDILEITYHVLTYNVYAVTSKALRLEYDDVDDRIKEVPMPKLSGDDPSNPFETRNPTT